jgi:hypothetical protein
VSTCILPTLRFRPFVHTALFLICLEVCSLAAGDLVRTGRAGEAEAALRSGLSVRELLRKLYGVTAAPEWDAVAERRAFLRMLRRAVN